MAHTVCAKKADVFTIFNLIFRKNGAYYNSIRSGIAQR